MRDKTERVRSARVITQRENRVLEETANIHGQNELLLPVKFEIVIFGTERRVRTNEIRFEIHLPNYTYAEN